MRDPENKRSSPEDGVMTMTLLLKRDGTQVIDLQSLANDYDMVDILTVGEPHVLRVGGMMVGVVCPNCETELSDEDRVTPVLPLLFCDGCKSCVASLVEMVAFMAGASTDESDEQE